MTVLRVENGDVYLPPTGQMLEILGEPEATMQLLRDAFDLAMGDWFLDQSQGIDKEVLVGKLSSMIPPEVEIRRVLSRVPSVTQIIRVRARRVTSRADALLLGGNTPARWDEAPHRILHVEALVTTRTVGDLELGFAFALPAASS